MELEMFDKVLLKTGETAFIVEIFDDGAAYEMDINKKDGKIVTDTVWADQIEKKLQIPPVGNGRWYFYTHFKKGKVNDMGEMMSFPETPEEFVKQYSFQDKKEEYTNGSELIPVFRVEQMIDHYFRERR